MECTTVVQTSLLGISTCNVVQLSWLWERTKELHGTLQRADVPPFLNNKKNQLQWRRKTKLTCALLYLAFCCRPTRNYRRENPLGIKPDKHLQSNKKKKTGALTRTTSPAITIKLTTTMTAITPPVSFCMVKVGAVSST